MQSPPSVRTAALFPAAYDDLRQLAAALFRGERDDHTLQPTALVHEAYAKLAGRKLVFRDRAHFFAVAARAMRQILCDHARARSSTKRDAGERVELGEGVAEGPAESEDLALLALEENLERLGKMKERLARVVELRVFGGLTIEEVADVLEISKRTVNLEWRAARAWLREEMRSAE